MGEGLTLYDVSSGGSYDIRRILEDSREIPIPLYAKRHLLRPMNYYRHHLGDYDSATAHLSWVEDMAYTRLIRLYYRIEKPLPPDVSEICRLVRAKSRHEVRAVEIILGEFFHFCELGWVNNRCDEEIECNQNAAKRSRDAGLLGGRPRREKTQRVSEKNPAGFKTKPSDNLRARVPITNSQEPIARSQEPVANSQEKLECSTSNEVSLKHKSSPGVAPKGAHLVAVEEKLGPIIWTSYSGAYKTRYGVDPVRNAKVNGQLSQLGKRLGAEAPDVACWYVSSNAALHVRSSHCVDLLLRDAEGLRTEWATGRHVTQTQARQVDRKQNNLNVAQILIAEIRERNAQEMAENGN